jgi:hypothetical protein
VNNVIGNKYHARKIIINGQKYDSQKEAKRGEELKMLQNSGHISGLKFQVPFVLQDAFRHDGKTERAIIYVADAVYFEEGKYVVEDTKSSMTRKLPVFQMKRKMLLKRYPEITFRVYE